MPIAQRFQIPANDDDFEQMCLELLRRHWSRPGLEIFGKRGERQFGIDILDLSGETPVYAAQCKLKEEHKSLQRAEIHAEVNEAKKFTTPLGRYAILTTAKVSTHSQMTVRDINQEHRAQGLFEVELLTWDQICPLLQKYSEVQEILYGPIDSDTGNRIQGALVAIQGGVQSLTSQAAGSDIDNRINEARDCINERNFQLATLLLNLVQHKATDLTPKQQYRVFANHGAAALGQGKAAAAAKYFLQALSCQPDDEQARTNEALAHLLAGDIAICHEKTTLLRAEYPANTRVAGLWVSTAPKEKSLSEIEGALNAILRADGEVALALSRRAVVERDFESARKYAEAAMAANARWAQPHIALAELNVAKALRLDSGFQPISDTQGALLRQAEEECSLAVEISRAERDLNSEVSAHVQGVDVHLLLKESDAAAREADAANRLAPDEPMVLAARARVSLSAGRLDEGIPLLRRSYDLDPRPDTAANYGKALLDRGSDQDLDDAIAVLQGLSLADFRPEFRPTVVTLLMQCYQKRQHWTEASCYLSRTSPLLDPVVVKAIEGYLSFFQGLREDADRQASEAQSLIGRGSCAATREFLANLLMLLGRRGEALPLWKDLFDEDAQGFDPGTLLDCAARLKRADIILEVCGRLRSRGVYDWRLIEFELPFRQKYDSDGAVELLEKFLNRNPNHKLATLRLSAIGSILNRPELVRARESDLPTIEELPLEWAMTAVQVMRLGGDPDAAVDYAYRFLRLHFGSVEAHQALGMSMLPGPHPPSHPPTLDLVGRGAAVCYQELGSPESKWVVIEETNAPNGDFEEIPVDSALAKALMGSRGGDIVVIAAGHIQNRSAKILHILPKYVRRYQDSMAEMQIRFGSASSVESVRFGGADAIDLQQGVQTILNSVKQRADAVEGARQVYSIGPISLHMYGHRFDENAYTSLSDIALAEGRDVKCNFGTSEEREQALSALKAAKAIVVDITALATLRLLDLTNVLSSQKFKFIISQATRMELREMLINNKLLSSRGETLMFERGRHVMYEHTEESRARGNRADEEFIQFVEATTELRSGVALATIEPEKRQALENLFGQYGAEALVLASDPDHILWTDDLIQAHVAAQEYGVRRVCTQLLLGTLADAGIISLQQYSEASARLIGMWFITTTFDASALLAGFRLAGWVPHIPPAAQFVKIFADPKANVQALFTIFVAFVQRLFQEMVSPSDRRTITRSLLEGLGRRPDGALLLTHLRKSGARVFGINAVGQMQFEECYDRWLSHREHPLILPG
jgi:tetratricopeptide (TPR) repeat protein